MCRLDLVVMTRELLELHAARLDDDLSFEELASALGIAKGTAFNILSRKAKPNERTLHKVRRFLDSRKARQTKGRKAS